MHTLAPFEGPAMMERQSMIKHAVLGYLFRIFGHRICCGKIPGWTAHVGQKWDVYDVAPYNLYNVIWRVQSWILHNLG